MIIFTIPLLNFVSVSRFKGNACHSNKLPAAIYVRYIFMVVVGVSSTMIQTLRTPLIGQYTRPSILLPSFWPIPKNLLPSFERWAMIFAACFHFPPADIFLFILHGRQIERPNWPGYPTVASAVKQRKQTIIAENTEILFIPHVCPGNGYWVYPGQF